MYIHSTMVGWKGHPPEVLPDSSHLTSDPKQNYQTLQDMEPQARNTAIAQLSDKQLQAWADGMNTWWHPPLSLDERRDSLKLLAEGLEGQQLHRAASAFGVQDMAQAVSHYGTVQQTLELLDTLQSEITANRQWNGGLGSTTLYYGNEHAHAAVDLLASLAKTPHALTHAIQSLQRAGKLDHVLKVAAGETRLSATTNAGSTNVFFDTRKLHDILAGVSSLPANHLSTRIAVFKATTPQLAAMQGNAHPKKKEETAQRTADALSKVLTREQAVEAGIVNMPLRPPAVSIYQNIQKTKEQMSAAGWPFDVLEGAVDWALERGLGLGTDSYAGWNWFYQQVRNGGPWDYKQLHINRKPKEESKYAPFGNFHYGIVAAAAHIPENIGLRGGGFAQRHAGTRNPKHGHYLDFSQNSSYGDDPADQAKIKEGYAYYRSGLWRVWKD